MSEMGSEEFPETPADRLNAMLIAFTGCIGEALDDLCTYGLTIGEAYVPFDPDEDEADDEACDDGGCNQMWVRVMSIDPKSVDGFGGDTCSVTLALNVEVGILRCFPIMEDGEAPTAQQVLEAHMQSMTDMQAILCAAMSCEAIEEDAIAINIGTWSPMGPMGGEYGGFWTFTIEV